MVGTVTGTDVDRTNEVGFVEFMREAEPRLRRAFIAAYGVDRGREAVAEALAYAWENWDRLQSVQNRAGYLYRVGQSRTRRFRTRPLFDRPDQSDYQFEPTLAQSLADLSERQRLAVVLVHGYGWTMREVSELTGIKVTTVQSHIERGLRKLRAVLEVTSHG